VGNLHFFPNPASEQATFLLPNGLHIEREIEIYNLHGQLVATFTAKDSTTLDLDVTGMLPGLYLVIVRTNKGMLTGRLVVQKQ
jgi:hypothetical protein